MQLCMMQIATLSHKLQELMQSDSAFIIVSTTLHVLLYSEKELRDSWKKLRHMLCHTCDFVAR